MKVFIMRGLPGSGKSTKARKIAQEYDAVICSADLFFDALGYFDPTKLGEAHRSCQDAFIAALEAGKNVVVDNTNTIYSEMKFYIDYAKGKHEVFAMYSDTDWRNDPNECFNRTIHGVPLITIQKMAARFEPHESIKAKADIKSEEDLGVKINLQYKLLDSGDVTIVNEDNLC